MTVQAEGGVEKKRLVEYYDLDVIISVGYRVKSIRGTQFRIWATQRLREYIIKGFAMDDVEFDARMKQLSAEFIELTKEAHELENKIQADWKKILKQVDIRLANIN